MIHRKIFQVLEEMKANKAAAQSTLFFTKEDVRLNESLTAGSILLLETV